MKKIALIIAAVFIATGAGAAEIDFSTLLRDQDGVPFTDCKKVDPVNPAKCERLVELTLGGAAIMALNVPEPNLALDEQSKRGNLALRISGATKLDLPVDDVKLIKDQMAKRGFLPILMVRALELLDPPANKKNAKP